MPPSARPATPPNSSPPCSPSPGSAPRPRPKFGEFARQMLFTQAGLEQATRLNVAARHAERFAQAGIRHVADLGCGLGADSMALASMDITVTAVEMDETTAACATMNLIPFPQRHRGALRCHVSAAGRDRRRLAGSCPPHHLHVGDQADLGSGGLLPAAVLRGVPGRVRPRRGRQDGSRHAARLGAGGLRGAVGLRGRRRHRGDAVVQRGARAPESAGRPCCSGRRAPPNSPAPRTSTAVPAAPVGPVEGYLYEPDGAVIRAGLVADVALELGGHLVDEHIAYICAPDLRGHALCPGLQGPGGDAVQRQGAQSLGQGQRHRRAGHQEARHVRHPRRTAEAASPRWQGRQQERPETKRPPWSSPASARTGWPSRWSPSEAAYRRGLQGTPSLLGAHELLGGPDLLVGGADARCTAQTAPAPGWWPLRRR